MNFETYKGYTENSLNEQRKQYKTKMLDYIFNGNCSSSELLKIYETCSKRLNIDTKEIPVCEEKINSSYRKPKIPQPVTIILNYINNGLFSDEELEKIRLFCENQLITDCNVRR